LTIGQSPRVDIVPELKAAVGFDLEIVERGALDGMSRDEVGSLKPGKADYVLVTRMRDGTEVTIAERHIVERMRAHVRDLESQGVDLIVLFCTGEFPQLAGTTLLLTPDRLLEHTVRGVLGRGTMAVVAPSKDQTEMMKEKWGGLDIPLVINAVSPYSAAKERYFEVAESISAQSPDLVVLDCMGFGMEIKRIFRRVTGVPVILPRTLLGRTVAELVEGMKEKTQGPNAGG
jgi:protein AroM